MKKILVRHKKDGWTGYIDLTDAYIQPDYYASHRFGFHIKILTLHQNTHDSTGKYVEDPQFDSLDDLEILGVE